MTRRRLLQGTGALALSTAAPVRWVTAAYAAQNNATASSWFSRASYPPLVGSTFLVATGAATTASLTLTAIGDLMPPSSKQRTATSGGRFSLLFTSAASFVQNTYAVRHATLGTADLFVVPVGAKGAQQAYEVIVNRLT